MPDQKFGDFAALALKAGAQTLHLNSTRVTDTDSQKALLEYQAKLKRGAFHRDWMEWRMRRSGAAQRGNTPRRATGGVKSSGSKVDTAYSKTQPTKILDFSEDISEGDKRCQRPGGRAHRDMWER
ncbi:Gastrulation defective protein 1-like, partial [Durusdinium trenchii]